MVAREFAWKNALRSLVRQPRQILREIPQLLAMGVGSQGNSRGPNKRFILGTFFLSWHPDIFIEGQDKTILETIVQGFFLDIVKKTQAQKNSKLKQNLEKTQAKSGKNSKTANSS